MKSNIRISAGICGNNGMNRSPSFRAAIIGRPAVLPSNQTSTINHQTSSFTLVEMMVVIAIMGVLASLLFPAVMGARNRAKKRQAMVESCNIAIAIRKFALENGRWPDQVSDASDRTYFTDNYRVINPLRIPSSNDRNRIYLQLQAGSIETNTPCNYVDPWGWPYIICMDENSDGKLSLFITNADYTNQFTGEKLTNYYLSETIESRSGAAAASLGGEDGDLISSWSEIQ